MMEVPEQPCYKGLGLNGSRHLSNMREGAQPKAAATSRLDRIGGHATQPLPAIAYHV
jgi:hypothetical protein